MDRRNTTLPEEVIAFVKGEILKDPSIAQQIAESAQGGNTDDLTFMRQTGLTVFVDDRGKISFSFEK